MTYCRSYFLCIVSLITFVILAFPSAFGESSLTCPIGNAADPTESNVDAPYLRDPSITSNALCRGACGEDCPSDRCRSVDDVRIPRVDDLGDQYFCVYKNVIACPTHQGCRDHDACFDRAAEAGEESIYGPLHRDCNYECIRNWTIAECVGWSQVIGDLGNPLIGDQGEPIYDPVPMLFSDRPVLEGPIVGTPITGNWQMGGPFNVGMSCQIIQEGNDLLFINERGDRSAGSFLDDSTIIAKGWEEGLRGTISSDVNRIDWANGTWWVRSPPHP